MNRIHNAASYCPIEQICISTQCGFASTAEGNLISEDMQWKKLELLREIAEETLNYKEYASVIERPDSESDDRGFPG